MTGRENMNRIASWNVDELGNYQVTLENGTNLNLLSEELDSYGYVDGVRRPLKVGDRFQALTWWKKRTARVVKVDCDEVVAVVNVVTYPNTKREERFKVVMVFGTDVDVTRTRGAVSVWCKRVYSSFNKSVPKRYRQYL
jgi:hypothetical protein